MNRVTIHVLRLAGLALALAASAHAVDTVTLKSEAVVKGPQVRLADVAEIQGENAERLASIELGSTPSPGATRQLAASFVNARIQTAGIPADSVVLKGAPTVRATALHLEVMPDVLEADLRQFIESQMPWDPAETVVDVQVPSQPVVIPDGEVEFAWRTSPQYKFVGTGTFRGELRVDGSLKKTFMCKANIETYGNVVVAARDIARGQTLGPGDVAVEKLALNEVPAGFAQNAQDVVGCVARNNIYAGQPVIGRNTVPRTLVKRGQVVNAEVRVGQIVVRIQASAKTDGREGDLLTCVNQDSKEEFQGVVMPDGTVVVN